MARLRLCCLVLFDPFSSRLIAISSVFLPFCPSVLRRACICPAENTKRTKIGILTDFFLFLKYPFHFHISYCIVLSFHICLGSENILIQNRSFCCLSAIEAARVNDLKVSCKEKKVGFDSHQRSMITAGAEDTGFQTIYAIAV